MTLKEQGDVAAIDAFVKEKGEATYGTHMTGERYAGLKYKQITLERYELIVIGAECLNCGAGLIMASNPQSGGSFWKCELGGHECYNVSPPKKNGGPCYELRTQSKGEP